MNNRAITLGMHEFFALVTSGLELSKCRGTIDGAYRPLVLVHRKLKRWVIQDLYPVEKY